MKWLSGVRIPELLHLLPLEHQAGRASSLSPGVQFTMARPTLTVTQIYLEEKMRLMDGKPLQ